MATSTSIKLADHETLVTQDNAVCYILFSRENSKDSTKRYTQTDLLPFGSSDTDDTFVVPRAVPIPTAIDEAGEYKPWVLDHATGIWERGFTTWGPPSLILRVFSYRGEYKQQLFFGKTWKKFDRAALKFDLNDEEIVRKYNKWLEYIFETFQTDPGVQEVSDVPWSKRERLCLRLWTNEYIRKEGLVAWASLFEWDDEVFGLNLFLRKCGCDGPGRVLADILKMFGRDDVIRRRFEDAQAVELRVRQGRKFTRKELHPKRWIPIHEALDDEKIEMTAEDSVRMKDTNVAEEEEADNEILEQKIAEQQEEDDENMEQTMGPV
ncbi:hypothetical protein HBI24_129900 [Parastagonospora nodorum]|nr:hypothetical protein HBI24_129900 [Parastagonospora nodorum]KAH6129963.1 hypothetical protein HBI64_114100 [Parastagonospora nodorum]